MANRLAGEVSPYLLQHAHNPVDWYPWGPEALERAKREDRPILLSIGYSACHWCHVMERESFEDDAIARAMNDRFVNVKVDREERPDLDQIYQLVVQLMGRSGGWPLTVFLTPDQRPFFAGTYFPPVDRYGMPGFPKVLDAVAEAYRQRRGEVDDQAGEIADAIGRFASGERTGGGGPSPELLARAARQLVRRFDEQNGGFGGRPKFPNSTCLDLLQRAGDAAHVRKALDAMRAGGIWDHLGGGFHRYSTDERWLVPHFEKMLYDNAQLLRTYVDSWKVERAPGGDGAAAARYEGVARSIAAYVAREMTAPEGGFYAAQDADSEGEEGKFFVWTPAQIDEACEGDPDAARAAKTVFGVTPEGNFEGSGATVLHEAAPAADLAALERARAKMLAARERRARPARDDKVLVSYSALMASGLALAGAALADDGMVASAERALSFLTRVLVVSGPDGRSRALRHACAGVARGPGFLDDHAFLGDAALDLYEATGAPRWVTLARSMADAILAHFHDPPDAGFFFTPDDGEKILVRAKDPYDHAVPGGQSVACRLLLRLGTLVDAAYAAPAERAIEKLASVAADDPFGMSLMAALGDRLVRGSVDVVLVGASADPATRALALEAHRAYLPDRVIAWIDPADPATTAAAPAIAEGKARQDRPAAYVCRNRTCSLPITDPAQLARTLGAAP
jgi:uncharacterized protein YyaL (SSP411 family)